MSLQPVPIQNVPGVPDYTCTAFLPKSSDYCLLIPVINEGSRILTELGRAQKAGVDRLVDIVICDGGSTDGSMNPDTLELYGVNTLLVKTGPGKQGAQLRMGLHFALTFGYKGVLTIDGNNKDSIEDVPEFVAKLKEGYDLVQGSRFIPGGHAINTPKTRYAAVRLIHAPIISAAAHQRLPRLQPRIPDPPRCAAAAGCVYGVRAAGLPQHSCHSTGSARLRGPRDPRIPGIRQNADQDQRL